MLPEIEEIAIEYATCELGTYFVHDNFARPFKVTVVRQVGHYLVIVNSGRRNTTTWTWEYDPKNDNYKFIADQIFLPSEQQNKTRGSITAGHCCLLKLKGKNRYVFIGRSIYSFVPYNGERITKFYSELIGSDVAYPIVFAKTYFYLLCEDIAIESKYFDPNMDWKSAYPHYYGHTRSTFYDIPGYEWKRINYEDDDNYEDICYNENYKQLRSLKKYAVKLPHLIIINNWRDDKFLGY